MAGGSASCETLADRRIMNTTTIGFAVVSAAALLLFPLVSTWLDLFFPRNALLLLIAGLIILAVAAYLTWHTTFLFPADYRMRRIGEVLRFRFSDPKQFDLSDRWMLTASLGYLAIIWAGMAGALSCIYRKRR